jgi:hypothetical protein
MLFNTIHTLQPDLHIIPPSLIIYGQACNHHTQVEFDRLWRVVVLGVSAEIARVFPQRDTGEKQNNNEGMPIRLRGGIGRK